MFTSATIFSGIQAALCLPYLPMLGQYSHRLACTIQVLQRCPVEAVNLRSSDREKQ